MKKQNTKVGQTSERLWVAVKGVPRLYKRIGKKSIAFVYKHLDRRSETLSAAPAGDKAQIAQAELTARRMVLDIQQGAFVAGSVAEMIERFINEVAPIHYADQSKNGISERSRQANNLKLFFGNMRPGSLKTIHGYQYLDARAQSGAPAAANKEMALMSTVCHQAIRWGLIERHPFLDLKQNVTEQSVRIIDRRDVVRFYLWAVKQESQTERIMGIAAMFSFLTGFRAAEVRPFLKSGITDSGVFCVGAKRKKGESQVRKLRQWSMKLRCVVKRAEQREGKLTSVYLFFNRNGTAYTRSGWGACWRGAWANYLGVPESEVTKHEKYFNLADIRPASITEKITKREADVYDFAAHASPNTTHKHYDRRRVKVARSLN